MPLNEVEMTVTRLDSVAQLPPTQASGTSTVAVAQAISIRDAGFDEYWLQDQIFENPAALGLGDLEPITRERQQSSGGRLDILLKDPEDDTMYEAEVMLGATNETHIIRTIEYWDNEKRKFPQRRHYAVLIAEHMNRRFFNVIQLFSHAIPIIAIQVSLIEVDGKRSLFFTTVLDTYEEIDDGATLEDRKYNRDYWATRANWTLETADALFEIVASTFNSPTLNYLKYYIAITVGGYNYMSLHKRSLNKSLLNFRVEQAIQDEIAALLDAENISYVRKTKRIVVPVDKSMVVKHASLFKSIAALVKKSWEG